MISTIASNIVRGRAPSLYTHCHGQFYSSYRISIMYPRSPSIRPVVEQKLKKVNCTPAHAQSTCISYTAMQLQLCVHPSLALSFNCHSSSEMYRQHYQTLNLFQTSKQYRKIIQVEKTHELVGRYRSISLIGVKFNGKCLL